METLITLVVFVAGFITGSLVTRNNIKKVNTIVDDAEDLASQINQKLDEIKEQSKPAKRGRPSTKK